MKYKYLRSYVIISIVIISLCILTSLHPTFMQDESFTFGLIHNNFSKIIQLDALDVHPPLYYLLLKLFLMITTFWTKSVFIKVIVSRIFSLISFMILYIYGIELFTINGIKINKLIMIIILLLCPVILKSSIEIRMYQLSATFLILELFNLIQFITNNRNYNLILFILFTILTSYTFYFSLVSGVIFIILAFIKCFYNKQYILDIKLICAGFIICLLYLPWIPVVLKQLKYHTVHNTGNKITFYQLIRNIIMSVTQLPINNKVMLIFSAILLIMLSYIIYKIYNIHSFTNNVLTLCLYNFLLTLIISLIICEDKFQAGVVYPIFIICILLISGNLSIYITKNTLLKKFSICVIAPLFIMMSLYTCAKIYKNINTYDIPSITLLSNYNHWKDNENNSFYINRNNYPINKSMTASEDAIYLNSIHKTAIIRNYNSNVFSKDMVNDPRGIKLTKYIFPNLYIKN